jgi:RimJ/RimL family protein N-acetyltransferase
MDDHAPPVSIPRVRTPRLLLREYRASDFDAFAASVADPIAQKHLSGTHDRRIAWRMFAAGTGFWLLHGAGWWAIELVETKEVVGVVGAFFRDGLPDLEIGWSLYRRFWGNGYATEAASAAMEHGLAAHGRRRAIAHIDPGNTPSLRVGERLGMRWEADVDLFDTTTGRYAIARP